MRKVFLAAVSWILSLNIALVHGQKCNTDEDCNLNGICGVNNICQCDIGWRSFDCGQLDLRPARSDNGYRREGVSSWGASIVRDPTDSHRYHMIVDEFTHGCGLHYWTPYSHIIRAESISGPEGPYEYKSEIAATFAHNGVVVYSPSDEKYLLYHIGCPRVVPSGCESLVPFQCSIGNSINGESGISVLSSNDLRHWIPHGVVMSGNNIGTWDSDTTNPSPFPLFGPSHETSEILLAYRGNPINGTGAEQIGVASAQHFVGPYTRAHNFPVFEEPNEDPFVWRDKRGHFHMLLHSLLPDGGFGTGPNVGRHAFARSWNGQWTFNNRTVAYNTTVHYTNGSSILFHRRERPALIFSEDGKMTPLYLVNGVQEVNASSSYTVIQPIAGLAL